VSKNRFIRFLITFIGTYISAFGAIWGLLGAYIHFRGDELKKILGAYWPLILYGLPLLIALLVAFIKAGDTQQRNTSRPIPRTIIRNGFLGENQYPLKICEDLQHLVTENISIIQKSNERKSYVNELIQDLKDGILRIYFFGHQNAGKSSLINALLKREVSPISSGRMTTCLVRIRWGKKARFVEYYKNGTKNTEHDITRLKRRMEEWSSLGVEGRPREVIIEIPDDILKTHKIEVMDSPGTGSAWNREYGGSIEDEIVNLAIKSTAVAVVVYRYINSEFDAHERLIRLLGNNNIPTIAVCNLDPNWAGELKHNKDDIQATIAHAEKQLRDQAKATCYRIAIKDDEELKELARQEDGKTIEDLRTSLIELLNERKTHVARQAIRKASVLIDELIQETSQQIRHYEPVLKQIKVEQQKISEAIADVREVLKKGYQPVHGTAWGAAFGTASTLIGGVAFSLLTAGTYPLLLAAGAAAGAAAGNFVDKEELKKFKKSLSYEWTKLQQEVARSRKIASEEIIPQEVIKKLKSSSSSLSESEHRSILNELEAELSASLEKVKDYETYHKNQNLNTELLALKKNI
jgi:GTPase SAR1 family protein